MKYQRSEAEERVGELLRTARGALNLSMAFMTRMDGTTQHLEVIESSMPLIFKDGNKQNQETSFCQAIWDGKLPAVMPDVRKFPLAMSLPSAKMPRLRSFISVPVILSDGTRYGTFCGAGFTSDQEMNKRDKALMEVLAQAAAVLIEPEVRERARRDAIMERLGPVIQAGGPNVVVQPIVKLATGQRIGAEALSRFPAEWKMAPDVCFSEAHSIGVGSQLELMAIYTAGQHVHRLDGYVSMNASPAVLLMPECITLLSAMPLDRVILDLSEHDPVEDYDELAAVIAPLRAAGMRLAIDDVGAGFSSLRHIIVTNPDMIKLDRTIVAGVHTDRVLRTLVHSLAEFGHACEATVVAEGIETAEDAEILATLGVDAGQGWYYGRPAAVEVLAAQPLLMIPPPRAAETLGAEVRA
jgi:EAL domain-containing protein (putative c-di-GMP-specific phosphodiesterase class I)